MYLLSTGNDSEISVQQNATAGYSVTVKRKNEDPAYVTNLSLVEAAQHCANLRNDGVKVPARFVIDFLMLALDSIVCFVDADGEEGEQG
jgi:hypothetical protein